MIYYSDTDTIKAWLSEALHDPEKTGKASRLAAACGVTPQAVYGWRTTGRISKSHLEAAAAFLGTGPRFTTHPVVAMESPKTRHAWPVPGMTTEQVANALTAEQRAEVSGMIRAFLSENARSGLPNRPAPAHLAPPQSTYSTGGENTPEWRPTLNKSA